MSKLNILIVEDSPLIAAALEHMIVKLGYAVADISESYDEAVLALTLMDIDLVITDIILIGPKTGIDLAAYIKMHFQIPVIYQSSITDGSMINDAMQTSPVAYLVKPVSKVDLSTALLSVETA